MTHDEIADAYRTYGHLVLRRCERILRRKDEAEDALQDVFVRLWRYGDAFRAATSKVSWLYRVAERCCFDRIAKRTVEDDRVDVGEQIADLSANQGAVLEDRDIVLQFLDRFDDRVKQVAVLHYLDELTQEEIATATGWSRQTIVKKLDFLAARATSLRATLYETRGAPR